MEESTYSEDLGVDGRIIIKLIFRQQGGWVWDWVIWLEIRSQ
jgi:hypothetical protein